MKDGKSRLLGVDWGSEKIGLSLCDPLWMVAHPLTIVRREQGRSILDVFEKICIENKVAAIILGIPLEKDGTMGEQASKVQRFKDALHRRLPYPIILWDEFNTSQDAHYYAQGKDPDAWAATLILEDVLKQIYP